MKLKHAWLTVIPLITGLSHGEPFFVSPDGDDRNPGTLVRPWKTIRHGAQMMAGGGTLQVRAGTYGDEVTRGWQSGTATAPTTIQAFPGETVVCRPGGNDPFFLFSDPSAHDIIVSGFKIDAVNASSSPPAIKITEGAHSITVTNCEIYNVPSSHGILIAEGNIPTYSNKVVNCVIHDISIRHDGGTDDHGIYVSGSVYGNVIDGNTIYNCTHGGFPEGTPHGIHQYDGSGNANNIYRNNTIFNCHRGIGLYSGPGALVYNNLLYSNYVGILVSYGASSNRIFNNSLIGHAAGIVIGPSAGDGEIVANNLVTGTLEEPGIVVWSGAGSTFLTNNVSCDNPAKNNGWDDNFEDRGGRAVVLSGNRFGNQYDAGFENAATRDFRPAGNSSAIDAGISLSFLFATDQIGTPRPRSGPWSAGAFEPGFHPPENHPPVVSELGDITLNGPADIPSLEFTVDDVETPVDRLTVIGRSSLQALVPDANLWFTGSDYVRTLSIAPAAGATGTCTVTVETSDGVNRVSQSFTVTILEPKPNRAPGVSAGVDRTVSFPETISLAGTVADDGLPRVPGFVAVAWSVASGPAPVTFGNANALTSAASFPVPGIYILRLTATDGALTSHSEVTLTVGAPTLPGFVVIPIPAVNGTLVPPMSVMVGTNSMDPSPELYLASTLPESGLAVFDFDIPAAGDYVIWCRTRSLSDDNDSFHVAVDGAPEEPYICTEGVPQPDWVWTRVNRRISSSPFAVAPRVFSLGVGTHTVTFRSREALTPLSALLITNDPDFVPADPLHPPN